MDNPIETAMAEGRELFSKGRLLEASRMYVRSAELAHRTHNTEAEAKALISLSSCRIYLFDYRGAQSAAELGRRLATEAGDSSEVASASVNLATIYSQLGDFQLAAKEAGSAAGLLQNSPNKQHLVQAMLLYANVSADLLVERILAERARKDFEGEHNDLGQIERNYRRGVNVAHAAGLAREEARLWEELGEALLIARRPQEAEEPLNRSYQLESANHDEDALAVNQQHRAELELENQHYAAALKLIDLALASHSAYFKSTPQYYPLYLRGITLVRLNREREGLAELRRSVDVATEWRRRALPADTISTQTVVRLHQIYRDYAQLAADLSLRNHDAELARLGFDALAENRAANLREQISRSAGERLSLPPRYFELLAEFQSAQAKVSLGENSSQEKARLEQIRLEMDGMENDPGLEGQKSFRAAEKNAHRNSLKDIQAALSGDEVLLSFSLGKPKSYLWIVTRDQLSLRTLPAENDIRATARQYARAVEERTPSEALGRQLSGQLFGQLPAGVWSKPEWLLVAEGALLDGVPFGSLPDLFVKEGPSPALNAQHSLRFLPSELLLVASSRSRPERRFLGIGDPIYNAADPRLPALLKPVALQSRRASVALSRLAGSDQEVRSAARESGMAQSEILVGARASLADLQRAIANRPEIVHFAVHVVSPDQEPDAGKSRAALALSLTRDNIPELLTSEAIATLRVPGSLVILSGCSSQKGEVLPGAGLMGLSRAWLLAGASAVVVSAWPTPDDSGSFFSTFYRFLQAAPAGPLARRAAFALQKAQLEMQHGGGYRSLPKFWAAYSIVSKE